MVVGNIDKMLVKKTVVINASDDATYNVSDDDTGDLECDKRAERIKNCDKPLGTSVSEVRRSKRLSR